MADKETGNEEVTAAGLDVLAPAPSRIQAAQSREPEGNVAITSDDEHVLINKLFGGTQRHIPRMRYAIAYQAANRQSGGDIADVFHYDNDHVSFVIADVAGKGNAAAAHAAMIKYSLRTLASTGLMPESVTRALNRLYFESTTFENDAQSFATVFFGIIDATRRFLLFSNAGHQPVFVVFPDGSYSTLGVTGPLIGVFGDQHHLFKQATMELPHAALLVATTDGVTEARNAAGHFYGAERLVACALSNCRESESDIAQRILGDVNDFSEGNQSDDIAIIVSRFLS